MPSGKEPKGPFKIKLKQWIHDTLEKTKERPDKPQPRYNKNYDTRPGKQAEVLRKDDHVWLRVEQKKADDHRHKLDPTNERPFKVTETEKNTVTIEKMDGSVENISISRLVIAPKL